MPYQKRISYACHLSQKIPNSLLVFFPTKPKCLVAGWEAKSYLVALTSTPTAQSQTAIIMCLTLYFDLCLQVTYYQPLQGLLRITGVH